MLRRFIMTAAVGAVVSLVAGVAQAELITFKFSGVIDSVADPAGIYENRIQNGSPYAATFVFDSATPDGLPTDSQRGFYRALSSTIVVGLVTFTGTDDDDGLGITDDPSWDWLALGCRATSSPDIGFASLEATFIDRTATVFSSDALPLPSTAPPLNAFQQVLFKGVSWANGSKFAGMITTFEVTPEPGTLWLLLLGVALARRRA